jgi:hypothetical protein
MDQSDRNKIHVVTVSRSRKSTRNGSAKRSADTTGNVADKRKVEAVRRELKEALRELEQIDFELEGGCRW